MMSLTLLSVIFPLTGSPVGVFNVLPLLEGSCVTLFIVHPLVEGWSIYLFIVPPQVDGWSVYLFIVPSQVEGLVFSYLLSLLFLKIGEFTCLLSLYRWKVYLTFLLSLH